MRLAGWSVAGILILLISANVNAAPHHVDYDDVEANISIILSYVQNAMDEINLTFEAMLSDDPANATAHGEHFIDSVKRVDETLDMIPVSVDSYQTLSSFQIGFSRFETNFSLVLSGYTMVIGSLAVFDSYDLSLWDLSSLGENLTSVDEAIDEFEEGFAILDERVTDMRDDLEALGSSGLNVEGQMDLSSGIIGYMDMNYHGLEREEVADELISHLVPEWSDGLRSLVDESDVDNKLAERLMILDLVVPRLSQDMLELLGERMDLLKAVDVNIAQFHDNQTRFLLAIEALENVTIRPEGMSDQYDLFNSTRNAYDEMEGKLEQQWVFLKEIDPINGDVIREDLTALEELLDSYRERLDNITLLIDQLNQLAELISLTLERNTIPADGDLDGQISFGEMRNLTMPHEMFSAMDEMVELRDVIENELSSMGSPWRDEVDPLFFSLSDGIDLTTRFSIDHDRLVTHLVNITFINETEVILQDEGHLLSALTFFNRMNGTISELEQQLDVIDGLELEVNVSVLEPLSVLLEQYKELLGRLAGDMNVSGLFLSFDDDVKPYDSTLLLNVLYLHRDPFGKVSYSDDDIISFFLDNVSLMDIFTTSGLASGVVPITRDMALGDHQVNVSVNSSTYGEILVSKAFTVRKILTDMVLTSSSYDVDLNEEVNIHVSVRDEFNRDVKGTILLDGKEMEIDGMIGLNYSFSTYGNHSVVGNFSGEEYYFNSSDELTVVVRDDPILKLLLINATIEIGQMIEGELLVEKGEGLVEVHIGEMIIPLGLASNGSTSSFSLNSSLLGLGSHRVLASLISSAFWVRDGVSQYVTILIIEKVIEEPVVEDPVVEDPIVEDPVEVVPPEDDENFFENAPFWKVALMLVMALMVIVVVFVFVRKERVRRREEKVDMVPVHEAGEPVRVERVEDKSEEKITRQILKKAAEHLGIKRIDPVRAGVVVKYIDMIEGSPEGIGLRTTLTPRENRSKLVIGGAGEEVSQRITSTFEKCVYHPGPPTKDSIKEYDASIGEVTSWYRSLPSGGEESSR